VHAETGAPTLKAQHPEFEMWNQGVHARSGVACADCHMPYQRVGAMKVSDHHVRSPLLNINRSCQTCHRWSEDELRSRVHVIQDRTFQVRNVAMDGLMALIADIKAAREAGATDEQLATARNHQRRAQFLLDFIEAENSMGFHADHESVRVLALSLDETRRGQASLPGSRASVGPRTEMEAPPQTVSPGTRPPGGGGSR
jgi:nitrite reductase (cytochrome c-552)